MKRHGVFGDCDVCGDPIQSGDRLSFAATSVEGVATSLPVFAGAWIHTRCKALPPRERTRGAQCITVWRGSGDRAGFTCFVIGWLMATGRSSLAESDTASYNDVYEGEGDVDPLAVMQNMMCEVERKMGIFPNVPPLSPPDAGGASNG